MIESAFFSLYLHLTRDEMQVIKDLCIADIHGSFTCYVVFVCSGVLSNVATRILNFGLLNHRIGDLINSTSLVLNR